MDEAEDRKHVQYKNHHSYQKQDSIDVPVFDKDGTHCHLEQVKLQGQSQHIVVDTDVPVIDSDTGNAHIEHVHYEK